MKLLIIEDQEKLAHFLIKGLKEEGHVVEYAPDGAKAIEFTKTHQFDVIISDIMMPYIDGMTFLSSLRSYDKKTPVLFLTAKDDIDSKLKAFREGGDDYLTKPFAFEELLVRIEALARRSINDISEKREEQYLVHDNLKVSIDSHKVYLNEEIIELTKTEFDLLVYLLQRINKVVTRSQFLENVKGYNFDSATNIVDVHIKSLRKKIDQGRENSHIKTIRGLGYMIEQD
ncbi:response regulator transcription factor [Halobacteriovorax sp. GB3]|uniref:response regulator transcription factor n=1 Tax=Halobacteriovorax sp. GB3 TaxID=2719615 RepID=UPI00235F846E|nr:response regulator transcription factor [Halobacteriovorax sp. GB3]MDD0852933.1 response regulator transcription factor [Halobacteriovorax sp. GB3]